VTLIERDRLGGDCLWYGCVPSKSLIHASRMAYQLKSSGAWPLNSLKLTLLKRLDTFKVSSLQFNRTTPERFESLGVEVIFAVVNL